MQRVGRNARGAAAAAAAALVALLVALAVPRALRLDSYEPCPVRVADRTAGGGAGSGVMNNYNNNDDDDDDPTCRFFADSYETARARFRAAAAPFVVTPLTVAADGNCHRGSNDDDDDDDNDDDATDCYRYTMDVVVVPGARPGVVVHVSGTHGVEGYAGSAVQVAFLRDVAASTTATTTTTNGTGVGGDSGGGGSSGLQTSLAMPDLCTVVLVHAFNPHGMAHFRRVNEHNVDLNRNGLRDDEWAARRQQRSARDWNARQYDKFAALFHGTTTTTATETPPPMFVAWSPPGWWDARVVSWVRTAAHVIRYGTPALKAALVTGQYHVPRGLMFGGGGGNNDNNNGGGNTEPSLVLLRDWMTQHLPSLLLRGSADGQSAAVSWIDVHTGLGKSGVDTLLPSRRHPVNRTELREWFPELARNDAASVARGYENVSGLTNDYYQDVLNLSSSSSAAAAARHLFLVQEFGTIHSVFVGHALMVENAAYHRHHRHQPRSDADGDNEDAIRSAAEQRRRQWSRRTLGPAFYPNQARWRSDVLHRGRICLVRAIQRSVRLSAAEGAEEYNIHS